MYMYPESPIRFFFSCRNACRASNDTPKQDREFVSKTSPHSNVRQPNDDFLKNVKKTHFLSKNHLSAALPLEGEVFLTNLALPLWWCVDARQQRLPPLCNTATRGKVLTTHV